MGGGNAKAVGQSCTPAAGGKIGIVARPVAWNVCRLVAYL